MSIHLAIDIGASSGRLILGWLEDGQIKLEEIYRFENTMTTPADSHRLLWDLPKLHRHILNGLKRCSDLGRIPSTLGIDTWGVDFVLLDADGQILGDAVAYRDSRTHGIDAEISKRISEPELYALTGIQKQPFNTLYQLAAVRRDTPERMNQAARLLMIPETLHYLLTGVMMSEYTNATTTGLVHARTKTWDSALLDTLGFPRHIFGELHAPGTAVGRLSGETEAMVGFSCDVLLPPTHDTACAFLAVPARDEPSVFISSGTWSLLGVENAEPVTTENSRAANFTNEGGYAYRYRYLKNIMGLWMLQSVRREADCPGFDELESLARHSEYDGFVDVNANVFLAPDSMTDALRRECAKNGFSPPAGLGDTARCIYRSLARSYAQSVRELESLTGRRYTSLNIIGGGSRDTFLNELTAQACALPVYAGPTEGTALGNIISQMIAAGELSGIEEARAAIRRSFGIQEVRP